jgi:hypothetical protein
MDVPCSSGRQKGNKINAREGKPIIRSEDKIKLNFLLLSWLFSDTVSIEIKGIG